MVIRKVMVCGICGWIAEYLLPKKLWFICRKVMVLMQTEKLWSADRKAMVQKRNGSDIEKLWFKKVMVSGKVMVLEKLWSSYKKLWFPEKLWSPKRNGSIEKLWSHKKLWSHRTQTAMAKAVGYGYIYGCLQGMKSCDADRMAVEHIRTASDGFLWSAR